MKIAHDEKVHAVDMATQAANAMSTAMQTVPRSAMTDDLVKSYIHASFALGYCAGIISRIEVSDGEDDAGEQG